MRVLVADKLSEAGVAALGEHFDVDVRPGMERGELLEAVAEADAVVIRSATTIDAGVIEAAPSLKVIARAGIGLDNVDVEAATARGVLVCNAPQSNVVSAAEHTMALMLSLARQVPAADRSLRGGEWRRGDFKGVELHGKTLAVLGLGRVGVLVAQRCSAFGMRLVAYDPFVSKAWASRLGVELVETVEEACEVADVLTVHLPRNKDTEGLIDAERLRMLPRHALVVNTARGGIVDEKALAEAVRAGEVAGAALDVFDEEPTTSSPLFELDEVVVTPHLGASTAEAQDKAGTMVADAVRLALAGEFVPSAVNVQIGAGVPEPVRPFMPLAEKLGRSLTALAGAPDGEITLEVVGRIAEEDTRAVQLAALKGVFTDLSHEPVTFVNAPLMADERGVSTRTVKQPASRDWVSMIRLRVGDVSVAGTLTGPGDAERIVELWGYPVDMEPASHLLLLRYQDRPGVIGKVGTVLGEAGINVAEMQVGRSEAGGMALMVLAVDEAVDQTVRGEVAEQAGASDVRVIDLD